MDLYELRKQPHLSASSINDYVECSLLYKLSRIDKLQPEFRSDALELGSAIHLVLAEFFKQKMVGKTMSIKELQDLFEKCWREAAEGKDDIKYADGKTFESILIEGKELLNTFYHKSPCEELDILAVEEPFSFNIQGCPIPVIGAWDLVCEDAGGTIVVIDWKTTGRAYSLEEVSRNLQMTIYKMAAKEQGYSDREILLRFDCLIKTKSPRLEQYYTTRSDADEKRMEKKIIAVWKGITHGIWIPNEQGWRCSNCAYKKHCNEWFER